MVFSLPRFDHTLESLGHYSYRYREKFYNDIKIYFDKVPIASQGKPAAFVVTGWPRLYALHMLEPVIKSTDTEYFNTKVVPRFDASIIELNEQLGVHGLEDIEVSPVIMRLSIELLHAGLVASSGYVADGEPRKEVEVFIADLGRLSAGLSPNRVKDTDISNLLKVLSNHHGLIARISQEPRTNGFGAMMTKIENYYVQAAAKY